MDQLVAGYLPLCNAIARRFAREGYNIVISSRDATAAQEAAKLLSAEFSVTARGYAMSYESVESIRETFRQVEADFGRLIDVERKLFRESR